jgi:hypothetical protein
MRHFYSVPQQGSAMEARRVGRNVASGDRRYEIDAKFRGGESILPGFSKRIPALASLECAYVQAHLLLRCKSDEGAVATAPPSVWWNQVRIKR